MMEEERNKEVTGEIEDQLNQVNADVKRVSEAIAKAAEELSDINEKLVSNFNIGSNPYTEYTLKGLKEMSESLMDMLTSRRSLLQDQLNKKKGSKASPRSRRIP